MVVLGLLLVAAGIVAIVAAVFSTSGTATFLGADLDGGTLFFLGVAATLALLCGLTLTRAGTGRALRHRREHRRLRTLERDRVGGHDADALPPTRDDLDQTHQDPSGG
jgi:uncharacterized integral membrane protein